MLLSMRMLLILFLAAILLNVTNYLFGVVFHNPAFKPRHRQRHGWSPELLCDKISTNKTAESNELNQTLIKKLCPELPEDLDSVVTKESLRTLVFHNFYSDVDIGGAFKPSTCISRQTVAIIVAFSGSKIYLGTFLHYMHPFLQKQHLDYQIFVVEQSNTDRLFNRGQLLNVAFIEAQRLRANGWQCIIIHEPNLLPVYMQNHYLCSCQPKQMAVYVERTNTTSYSPQFGGAVALKPEHFLKVNGFSNMYWGSDGDYSDMFNRLSTNFSIERSTRFVGKYTTLGGYDGPFVTKEKMSQTVQPYKMSEDGLSSLSYKLNALELKPLYTNIKVTL